MRKNYVKPALIIEEFIPELYCANCKANGVTTYTASCDTSGYAFKDDGDGVFENGIDEYKNHNSAGWSCNFEIDYYPGEKNAFILPDSSIEYGVFFTKEEPFEREGVLKEKNVTKVIYGYRIETDDNSHFIANLNSNTIYPNHS